jgi:hypothetical protein
MGVDDVDVEVETSAWHSCFIKEDDFFTHELLSFDSDDPQDFVDAKMVHPWTFSRHGRDHSVKRNVLASHANC